ncbi:MAG: hypothetical protein ABSG18_06620 [Steroidobacteraceae bacterium]|jgi:hypothetical protein
MDKKSSNIQLKGNLSASRQSTPWHAVSVVTGRWCCDAARGIIGSRFLSREAPRLPLAQCSSMEACSCSYRHHVDRRGTPRRKDEAMGMRRMAPVPNERRLDRGRRADD